MNINNFGENKILYTQNIWKWIKLFLKQKDAIIITPFTKINKLINFKNDNILRILLNELSSDIIEKGLNFEYLNNIKTTINKNFDADIMEIELNYEKIMKTFFEIEKEFEINEKFLKKYLNLLDKNSNKQLQIIIVGFDMAVDNYAMITVHKILNNISGIINWTNIEQLIFLDIDNGLEIIDSDKFKSWLELKTKTVLTNKDLDQYFKGHFNMQSFLIEKALKTI